MALLLTATDRLHFQAQAHYWYPEAEDGTDELISFVGDPQWRNEDLLQYTLRRANRGSLEERAKWMSSLLEFCIWQTHELPHRLDLCQHIINEGLADFHHEPAWAQFGGLLHIAAEAGSLAALQWAYSLKPEDLFRLGGSFKLSPLHCAARRSDPESTRILETLLAWGANPHALTRDGRDALFPVVLRENAQLLMKAGLSPLSLDPEGFNALGLWLEMGDWNLASLCFEPEALFPHTFDKALPYGSFSHAAFRPQRIELPAAIYAYSIHASRNESYLEDLFKMMSLGADIYLRGPMGKTAFSLITHPTARVAIEHHELSQSCIQGESSSSKRL